MAQLDPEEAAIARACPVDPSQRNVQHLTDNGGLCEILLTFLKRYEILDPFLNHWCD